MLFLVVKMVLLFPGFLSDLLVRDLKEDRDKLGFPLCRVGEETHFFERGVEVKNTDTLHSADRLRRKLGKELFAVLADEKNFEDVRVLAKALLEVVVMPIEDRVYESIGYLHAGDTVINGSTMITRAKRMSAYSGEEECCYFLDHQKDIPIEDRDNVIFIFPGWRSPDDYTFVACVIWGGGRWSRYWRWLGHDWLDFGLGAAGAVGRLIRRKQELENLDE